MTPNDSQPDKAARRQQAEAKAGQKAATAPENLAALGPEAFGQMLHELQVHQIELEMQNEELRRVQAELDASRARYFNLYDLAPVGYCTLSEAGLILDANITAATLLGATRSELVKQPLSRFILKEDEDIYYHHRQQLFMTGQPQACELRMAKPDGAAFCARFDATATQAEDGTPLCRLVMSDITERKRVEETQAFLLRCGMPGTGEDFFASLARYLAETLGMEYICIDRLEGDGQTAQTVAVYNSGQFECNVSYALKDTPCGEVVRQSVCCFPRGVQALFPKDAALQQLNAESYVGTTLMDSKGQPIGLIALIGQRPLADSKRAESLLRLVGPRAAGELERRRAEAALRESEADLREAQNMAQLGRWELDLTNNYLQWSDTIFTIFEMDPAQFGASYEAFLETIHPEDRKLADSAYAKLLERKLPYEITYRLLMKDGRIKWLNEKCRTEFNSQGQAVRSVGIVQDITERKRAERETAVHAVVADLFLQCGSLETTFQKIAESLVATLEIPIAAIELYDVQQGCMIFVGVAGMPGLRVGQRVPVHQTLSGVVATSGQVLCETRARQRTEYQYEKLRQLEVNTFVCVPLRIGAEVLGTLALADQRSRDDAALWIPALQAIATRLALEMNRKRAEVALKESEEKFRQLTEGIREVFWLGSLDWTEIYYISPAYTQVWGKEVTDLYKNPRAWYDSVCEEDKEKVRNAIPLQIPTSTSQIVFPDYRIKRPDGSLVWISARAFPLVDSLGLPCRIAGIAEDVTERKQAELALQQKLAELERVNRLMVGRENRMLELKREINELCRQANQPERYAAPNQLASPSESDKP
jgi:PAS domain S-box-containing protein